MSQKGDSSDDPMSSDKQHLKRKLCDIPFRGWAVRVGDQTPDVTPTIAEIDKAVELAKSGKLEEREFSANPDALAQALIKEAQGDLSKFCLLSREYHAERVAYLVIKKWEEFPIEVMANGDMRDGQHRWLAAKYLELEEVDIVVIEK